MCTMTNMAEKVNAQGLTEKEFLESYDPGEYERPSVTVDAMVLRMRSDFKGLQVLLIQRKDHPYIDCFALPGGFINMNESSYEAIQRELMEETGLTNVYMEQLYTMSKPDRDPRMRIIDIAYIALLPYGYSEKEAAGDDAKDAAWFDISLKNGQMVLVNNERNIHMEYRLKEKEFINGVLKLNSFVPRRISDDALAFDHAEIIMEGLLRLRNKVEYTDIVFNLMPKEFTLPDLQSVYEMLLGKSVYKRNFRDKMSDKITSIGKQSKPIAGRRMAELYEYKGESV